MFKLDKDGKLFSVKAGSGVIKDPCYITLNSDKWLLTQATAVSSVNLFDGYKITPATADYVNNNGNSWDTDLLRKTYKSFIGCHNYKNHVQDPKQSYGIVLDAVPRKIDLGYGEWNLYVDILVATHRPSHPDWCKAIEEKRIKYGSVGCSCSTLQCSKCGHIASNPSEFCACLDPKRNNEKGKYYVDPMSGGRLRVAAMVKPYPNKDGKIKCQFTEWSYLDNNPAYVGAALAYVIPVPRNTNITFECDRRILKREAFKIWENEFEDVKY